MCIVESIVFMHYAVMKQKYIILDDSDQNSENTRKEHTLFLTQPAGIAEMGHAVGSNGLQDMASASLLWRTLPEWLK